MNQLLPYEKVFAKKMEQLPVPEMADIIWGNIQDHLNTGLENLPGNRKTVFKKVKVNTAKVIWWVSGCIVVIIICVLLFKRRSSNSPKINLPEKRELSLPVEKSKNVMETSPVSDHNIEVVHPDSSLIADSIILIHRNEPLLPIRTDSADIAKPFPQRPDSILKTPIILPGKKSIGVMGISDSSYRIAGKRDSMK